MTRPLRRILIALAALVAVALLGVFVGFSWLRGDSGRAWLVETIEQQTDAASGFAVSIEALEGDVTETLVLKNLALSDREGRWLTVAEARVQWRPQELLEGRLHLVSLEVDELAVERPPRQAPSSDDEATAGEISLPVELRLDQIDIRPLTLGPAFLGEATAFDIEGQVASHEGDELRSRLSMVQRGEIGGTLEAEATYRLSDEWLRADLDLAEPTGRLMQKLTGLAQAGATSLALAGEGDLSAWRGRTEFSSAGLGTLQSELTLGLSGDPSLQAEGSLRADWQPPGLPPGLLEGEIRFAFDASLAGGDRLALTKVALENDAAAIDGQGELQLASNDIAASVEIKAKNQSLLDELTSPASVTAPVLKATLAGSIERPEIKADVAAKTVSVPGLESGPLTLGLSVAPEGESLVIAAEGRLDSPVLTDLAEAKSLLGPALTWRLDSLFDVQGERFRIDLAKVNAAGFDLEAKGDATLEPKISLSARLTLGDLALLAPITGLQLAGGLSLDADLRSTGQGLEAELKGAASGLSIGEPLLDQVLGPDLAVTAEIATADFDRFSLSNVALEAAPGTLGATLDLGLGKGEVDGDLDVELPDLQRLSPLLGQEIAGSARLGSKLAGKLDDPGVEGRLELAGLRIDPLVPSNVTIDFTSQTVVSRPSGRIDVELEAGPVALATKTTYALLESHLQLDDLTLASKGLAAKGNLKVPLEGRPVSGQLDVAVEDLAPTLSLLALSGGGRGTANLALGADGGGQSGTLAAAFEGLRLVLSEDGVLDIGSAALSARSNDLQQLALSELSLTLQEVASGDMALDRVDLSGRGSAEALEFELGTEGDVLGTLVLNSAGSLALADGLTRVRLDRLDGTLLERALRLNQAAELSYGEGRMGARAVSLTFGAARLDLEASVSPEASDVALNVTDLPLALARLALPDSEFAGTASLEAKLAGASDRVTGSFTLDAADVTLGKDLEGPPLAVAVAGQLTGDRLESEGTLSGFSESDARFDMALPFRLGLAPFSVVMPQDPPLSGSADWQGELAQVWALVPLDGHRATGRADVAVSLSGSLAEPRADGTIRLEGGEYENFEAGTLLRELTLLVEIAGERVEIRELTGNDGGAGTLTASGALELAPEKDFPFDLEAVFSNFTLARRDEVTAASNGTLKLAGRTTDAAVEGAFETTEVEIRIPDTLPPEIAELEVIEEGSDGEPLPAGAKGEAKADSKIALDLAIDMPARVFVRGRGLDTEWAGRLKVSGTAAAPRIEGELRNVRGQLRAVGKEFTLENSKITLAGTEDLTPLLDIRAVYEADDIVVTALVTGTPDQPTITLSSVPTLPRDEIIARVLFGKSTAQLSPIEAIQLASSAAELSGSGFGAGGVLDFTRDLIGVDVLSVDASESEAGGAEVRAGKYVSEDVFVGVKQGTTPGSSSVEVEVELTPNISLQSDVGQSGEGNLGVKFKWDY